MYEAGKGVPRDCTEATKWFLEAAECGNCKAEFNIGLKYEKGSGVAQNSVEAYKWLHLAVLDAYSEGHESKFTAVRDRVSAKLSPEKIVEALRKTGDYCIENTDSSEGILDYAEAERLYRTAAEQGNAAAQFEVGLICSSRGNDFPKIYGPAPPDYPEAANWFRKAADQGNIDVQYLLGRAYINGKGVPQDNVQALLYLSLAALGISGEKSRFTTDPRSSAANLCEELVRIMTVGQIVEAQRLTNHWKMSIGNKQSR